MAIGEPDDHAGPPSDSLQVGVEGGQELVVWLFHPADRGLGDAHPAGERDVDRMSAVEALPPRRPIHGQMVMLPTPPPGGFTAADLPTLIEAVDARFELLEGEVLMMAPATHWHDEVIDILKHALRQIAPQSLVIATEKGMVDRPFPIDIELPEVTW